MAAFRLASGHRAGGAVPAVPAAGVGGDVGADEAEDGGERDEPGVDARRVRQRGRPRWR